MRIRLDAPYNYVVSARLHVQYQAGDHTVKREWGEAMVKAGVATEIEAPAKNAPRPLP